jgi:hypothetical protein
VKTKTRFCFQEREIKCHPKGWWGWIYRPPNGISAAPPPQQNIRVFEA